MTQHLLVPDRAVKYILFQRTAYFRLPVTFLYRHVGQRLPFPVPIYNVAAAIESRLDTARIKRLYDADMASEYDSIKRFLPETCAAILDIGCGVAGIDVLLNRHYADQHPDFYLLDRSQVERNVFYLFQPRAAFYNSLDVARELLVQNGVADERIHLLEANDEHEICIAGSVDLVISLLSWGFHYPVATYCGRVWNLLSDGGIVILDVRHGTDGMDVLRKRFRSIDLIVETEKYQRVACSK